jgi:3-oxoacyl-[acyl-carrier-protein] synthase-3
MGESITFLAGASYVLGEHEADHTSISNLAELADQFKLVVDPDLWGWGTIRTTSRELENLAVRTGRATLRAAAADPASVDALVLCSTRVPGPAEGHGEFVASVLSGIGLGDIPCYGVSLNRCVNLLAGIDVARALVACGRYQRVLVITTDKVADGAERMSQFALFSDGAASCLISSDLGSEDPASAGAAGEGVGGDGYDGDDPDSGAVSHPGGYELLGCATAQDIATLEWTSQISADLAREVNERLLGPLGCKLGDIAALAHANIYKPLVVMKERQAGFSPQQLYTDNVTRLGHCFAADPLINLVDRAGLGHVGADGYCLLAASVPGSRIGALLRRVR